MRIAISPPKPGGSSDGAMKRNRKRDQGPASVSPSRKDQHGEPVAHEIVIEDGKKNWHQNNREGVPQQPASMQKAGPSRNSKFSLIVQGLAWPDVLTMIGKARIFRSSSSTESSLARPQLRAHPAMIVDDKTVRRFLTHAMHIADWPICGHSSRRGEFSRIPQPRMAFNDGSPTVRVVSDFNIGAEFAADLHLQSERDLMRIAVRHGAIEFDVEN